MMVIDETHIYSFGIGIITSIILNFLLKFDIEVDNISAGFCPEVQSDIG